MTQATESTSAEPKSERKSMKPNENPLSAPLCPPWTVEPGCTTSSLNVECFRLLSLGMTLEQTLTVARNLSAYDTSVKSLRSAQITTS